MVMMQIIIWTYQRSYKNMNITSAQYQAKGGENTSILAVIDGQEWCIPLDEKNSQYVEIKKQVKEGTLTIKDAD